MISPQPAAHQTIDDLLRVIEQTTDTLVAEEAAALRRADEFNDEEKRLLGTRIERGQDGAEHLHVLTPEEILVDTRHELAIQTWHMHRKVTRNHAAWWADVAALAVLSLGQESPPSLLRLLAADPSRAMSEEQAGQLSGPDDDQRETVRLTSAMTPSSAGSGLFPNDEYANYLGLHVTTSPDGERTVRYDSRAEGRRRVIWGALWADHAISLLSESKNLFQALDGRVDDHVLQDVHEATNRLDEAIALIRQYPLLVQRTLRDNGTNVGDDELERTRRPLVSSDHHRDPARTRPPPGTCTRVECHPSRVGQLGDGQAVIGLTGPLQSRQCLS